MRRYTLWLANGALAVIPAQDSALAAERVVMKFEGLTRFG